MRGIIIWTDRVAFVAKWAGATLFFLSIIGFFEHPRRVEFYEILQANKSLPAKSSVTSQFMSHFGFPDKQIAMIDTLVLKGLSYSGGGRSVAGVVVAKSNDGRQRTIADLTEVRTWAYSKSPLYDWLALILIIIGLIVESWVRFSKQSRADTHPQNGL